jgi:hypothetical protein
VESKPVVMNQHNSSAAERKLHGCPNKLLHLQALHIGGAYRCDNERDPRKVADISTEPSVRRG